MQADLFRDRTAIVTGGARGIGLACAAKIAAGGGRVALWDRDMDRARQSAASLKDAIAVEVDVTSEASVAKALAATEDQLAPPDILVASAGITGPNTTVVQLSGRGLEAGHRHQPDRRLPVQSRRGAAAWPCAAAAASSTSPRSPARKAIPTPRPTPPPRRASSASPSRSARNWPRRGVLVNCVAPAVVKTELFSQMTEQHIQYMLSKIPMNRFGEVDEVAEMVAWLASDLCTFATGATFDLSGGRATY